MSEKDKIYELFRQNEHKLDEKPSRRAWERVDARLDRHYARRQSPAWFKYGGMVAATLILVFTASMLVMNNSADTATQFADNSMAEKSIPLMDLSIEGDIDNHMRIVAYQNEYKNRANRISERSIAGDLKPRGEKIAKKRKVEIVANGATTTEIVAEAEEEDLTFADVVESDEMDDIAMNIVAAPEPEIIEEEIVKEKKREEKPEIKEKEKVEPEPVIEEIPTETAGVMIAEEVTVAAVPSKTAAAKPTAPAKGNADYEMNISAKDEVKEDKFMNDAAPSVSYDMNTDDGGYLTMEDEKEALSLENDFSWILGKWKGKVKGSTSYEVWTKVNASTYKGKGTLIAGGTTLFTEKLELRITDVGTYLTISLEKKNKRVAYRMTSNNGYTIVFANNSVDYPKKIILTKKSDDTYSMVMQAGDTESLDNDQVMYLENRNEIQGAKMIRPFRKDD